MKWLKKLQNTYLNKYLLSRYSRDYQVDIIRNTIWKIYRLLREEDKNFKYHRPSFKFIRVLFSVPLTTWPWAGIVMKVYNVKITEVTAIWLKDHQRGALRHRKVLGISQRGRHSGEQSHRVVYECLGTSLSCSQMERILIRIEKKKL